MRALIDIPDRQLMGLSAICATKKLARAEAVRQAIDLFIQQNRPPSQDAFGLWKDRAAILPGEPEALPRDGLAYQERLRSEW